jgi:hypothetical protein
MFKAAMLAGLFALSLVLGGCTKCDIPVWPWSTSACKDTPQQPK